MEYFQNYKTYTVVNFLSHSFDDKMVCLTNTDGNVEVLSNEKNPS